MLGLNLRTCSRHMCVGGMADIGLNNLDLGLVVRNPGLIILFQVPATTYHRHSSPVVTDRGSDLPAVAAAGGAGGAGSGGGGGFAALLLLLVLTSEQEWYAETMRHMFFLHSNFLFRGFYKVTQRRQSACCGGGGLALCR